MSMLERIKNAATSPENLRDMLESLGWQDFILMHSVKNKPFWGWILDPKDNTYKNGYEINPDAVEYGWEDHTEEEIQEAVERMYYEIE